MVTKAADDLEAIRAGLARIEEERLRKLNGIDSPPESLPIEAYEGAINYYDPNQGSQFHPWGLVKPATGAYRFFPDTTCLVFNGRAWVSEEEWQDKGVQS